VNGATAELFFEGVTCAAALILGVVHRLDFQQR
jgi:hypothetical protein